MSYAGTYGPDETCSHDQYRPSCWRCNGAVERYARERPVHLAHAQVVAGIPMPVEERVRVTYAVTCPGCGRTVERETREQAAVWWESHVVLAKQTADDWRKADEVYSEAVVRGLL